MRIGNLTGHMSRVLSDTRIVVNPFGIKDSQGRPFAVEILRGNHDDWANFLSKEQFDDPQARKRRRANLKAALSGVQAKGFRKQKVKPEKVVDELVEDLISTAVDPSQAAERAARKKAGAAEILWRGGSGLEDESGTPLDLSKADVRLSVLLYNSDPVTGQPLAITTRYLLDAEGNPVLDDGDPIENPYLNMLFGDALLAWSEDEAEEIELFYLQEVQQVLGDSKPSPVGSPANGTDSTQSVGAP